MKLPMTAGSAFFTICARNYLAFGAALGVSVLRHHPDATFTIWLLDSGEHPPVPAEIRLRPITELFEGEALAELGVYYDILELATAVKPRCFQAHFAETAPAVVYIDPDILLFRPLSEIFDLLDAGAQGVLTPHIMAPLPRDGEKPDDLELLQSGIYNLGFLALAADPESDTLLDWWWGWLETHCFSGKHTGVFTDQKWMNFAPLFWPRLAVLRDTSYNIAYWNLTQRCLERDRDGWTVNAAPLTFFHFSGFNPGELTTLSKHQTRIEVMPRSPLGEILQHYARIVMDLGHEQFQRLKPELVRFDNGLPVDSIARRAYHLALEQGLSFSHVVVTGAGSFYEWLCGPVYDDPLLDSDAPPITNYLYAVYQMRPDVRQVFPDVFGTHRNGFLKWAARSATVEEKGDAELVQRQFTRPKIDVTYLGFLSAMLGIGEAARGYANAMSQAGIGLHYIDISASYCASALDSNFPLPPVAPEQRFRGRGDFNIWHLNPDRLDMLHRDAGPHIRGGRYTIGIWAWESLDFPREWQHCFDYVNEIWVGSSFMADSISKVSPVPVIHVPHMLDLPEVTSDRAHFGLPEEELALLFYFDFHSTPTRKNPAGTIEAFRRAFGPEEPVRLVLKSMNGARHPEALEALKTQAAGLRITFIDKALPSTERYRLLASCDAFVSLHRAEGFGLGLAEAMALGKPVIATGWSGNMDFMTVANSLPVRFHLERLEREDPPYPAGTLWAEPDLDDAARLMRLVWEQPELRRAIGERARSDIRAEHSPAAIGRVILERLSLLKQRRQAAATVPQIVAIEPLPASPQRHAGWVRRTWRLLVRFVPIRFHPALARLSAEVRRLAHSD